MEHLLSLLEGDLKSVEALITPSRSLLLARERVERMERREGRLPAPLRGVSQVAVEVIGVEDVEGRAVVFYPRECIFRRLPRWL